MFAPANEELAEHTRNAFHRWLSIGGCPASPEKEDQRAAGSPAALTQLALCLRLAIDLKGRKLATRLKPSMTRPHNEDYHQVKLAVKT